MTLAIQPVPLSRGADSSRVLPNTTSVAEATPPPRAFLPPGQVTDHVVYLSV
jgi:hypothetical protein